MRFRTRLMLAVRRSGVTVTLHTLEGTGAIRSSRGIITITKRARLEEIAGEAYGEAEAEYRLLIGPLGRGRARDGGRSVRHAVQAVRSGAAWAGLAS